MKIRRSLLSGLIVACLWPAAHAAESPQLAQIKARVSEARQKSFGPFASFAGVYDILKSCRPLGHPDRPLSAPDAPLGAQWLLTKSVIWFEGNDILHVKFVTPANVERGTLKFKQNYLMPPDGIIVKLYDVNWNAGDTDIMAFLPDRDLFDGKFDGRTFTFNYGLRCGNEDQIIGSTDEILRLMGL